MLFHAKICGVRFKSDIEAVGQAGGDAIGLNFFPPSIRYVRPDEASALSEVARRLEIKCVGVFVNESAESIAQISQQVGLDVIQLHGDETLDDLKLIREATRLPVLRAIKLPTGPLDAETIESKTQPWISAGCDVLLDADAGAAHGGSGKTLDWDSVRQWAERSPEVNWTLAGGLTPENVAVAMQVSGAKSVDTASGAEQPKGTKSRERIAEFLNAALK
ncbi:N-(5'-phosphoribosyl)anthranilate isomerase [Rubripirellula amarantea]|uniref:N-(5'-phosphoribosyl)anthranilate isomerase n=1 Tax=Rubripirellula amarantea TaxID=2527999 RepID=A0A5C5WIH8_9BACT|nr:phosphoribosylanthranilate isomerase [Rubripirellula amarantea]TWT50548.1 N-(5'-phosphoribosyl)anthranilate isomerase [Rubripirellula amarantea]